MYAYVYSLVEATSIFETVYLTEPGADWFGQPGGQLAPRVQGAHLCPPPAVKLQVHTSLFFFLKNVADLKSGLHAHIADILTTGPSPRPRNININVIINMIIL